jgi:two-component sensor histidine kinase
MVRVSISLMAGLFFITSTVCANHQVDSLVQELSVAKTDTQKISLNIKISQALLRDKKALDYAKTADDLSSKLNDKEWQAKALFNSAQCYLLFNKYDKAQHHAFRAFELWEQIGRTLEMADSRHLIGDVFRKKGEFNISIEHFDKGLELYTKLGDRAGIAKSKNSLGVVQKNKGNLAIALKYYLDALNIREQLKDENGVAAILSNIGVVYRLQNDFEKSLEYNLKALDIRERIGYRKGIADSYNNIGIVFKNQGKHKEALDYYRKSLEIRRETGNVRGEAYCLNNIAVVYLKMNNLEKSLEYNLKSLDIKEKLGDKFLLISSYLNIGQAYYLAKNYELAEKYYLQALDLSKELEARESRVSCHKNLALLYANLGKHQLAYDNQKKYTDLNDSIRSLDKTRVISELQAEYEYKKLRLQDSLKYLAKNKQFQQEAILDKERDKLEREQDAKQFVLIRNALIIGFGLVLLLAISLYSRYRIAKRSREKLKATNKELSETLISKDEKEVLLREIHHRVKNNLQIITSLIRLQAQNVKDEEVLEMFSESQNRIKSMALVHEELYQTSDLANVNVNNYLTRLIKDLIFTYTIEKNIDADIAIEVETLGIDTLVPLGLIVNEIISNSLKHAFDGRTEGNIFIHLNYADNKEEYLLHVGDNGKGFEGEIDAENSATLGLELVYTLVDQLDGKVELSSKNGVVYDIIFKKA